MGGLGGEETEACLSFSEPGAWSRTVWGLRKSAAEEPLKFPSGILSDVFDPHTSYGFCAQRLSLASLGSQQETDGAFPLDNGGKFNTGTICKSVGTM